MHNDTTKGPVDVQPSCRCIWHEVVVSAPWIVVKWTWPWVWPSHILVSAAVLFVGSIIKPTFHILNFHRCCLFRMVPPCSTQPKANLCNSAIRLDYEKNSFELWTSCFSRKDRSHSFTLVLVRSFPSSGLFKVLVGTPLVELPQSRIYVSGSNLLFVVSSTLLLPVVKQNVPQWPSRKPGRLPISHGTVGDVFLAIISQIPSTIFIQVIFLAFSIARGGLVSSQQPLCYYYLLIFYSATLVGSSQPVREVHQTILKEQ